MPDSQEIIGALSDGNAHGSPGSLGLSTTAHGNGADEQKGATEELRPVVADEPHPVVTDEPQPGQPGADGEPPPTFFASKDGPTGPGPGNATPTARTKPPNLPSRSYASGHLFHRQLERHVLATDDLCTSLVSNLSLTPVLVRVSWTRLTPLCSMPLRR
jgi:hypothetical protein